ncbi:MAG TPA: MFS transporter [Chloroflexota bacterium]|nr:MFS transporter [Chloroflexota bacterium]
MAASARARAEQSIDYVRVGFLSLGHLMNDMYGNTITALMPYLVIQGRISATLAGLVLLVYLVGSSVLQPFFGLHSDRSGTRVFAIAGPLWIGVAAGLVGWAGNDLELFLLAALGGVGTAAFHPQAASMVAALSPRHRGWTMSIFSTGGNLGFALAPVLAATVAMAGLHWSPIIILPAALLAAVLARRAPEIGSSAGAKMQLKVMPLFRQAWRPLSLVVGVIATRSAVQYALILFLPLYYHNRGFPAELGSYYAFVLSLSGAVGGLLGGSLSDRYGRRLVVVLSLVTATPLLFAALLSSGFIVWPLLSLAGATLLASNSVTVVQGQELLPHSTGIASGLTMGLGFGLSGVISSGLAALSDHIGVTETVYLVPLLALVAAVLGVFAGRNNPPVRPVSS